MPGEGCHCPGLLSDGCESVGGGSQLPKLHGSSAPESAARIAWTVPEHISRGLHSMPPWQEWCYRSDQMQPWLVAAICKNLCGPIITSARAKLGC